MTYSHPSMINLFRNIARQTQLAGRVLYLSAGREGDRHGRVGAGVCSKMKSEKRGYMGAPENRG